MSNLNLLVQLKAIDLNHNGKIDGPKEVKEAQSLGINAQDGDSIEKLIQNSSKINLQDILKQIDQTQTVDNKQNPLKKSKFFAIG